MLQRSIFILALLGLLASAAPAGAADWWPIKSRTERLLEEARQARLVGELAVAQQRLTEAQGAVSGVDARILHEAGLLAWAKDDGEEAARLLQQAADVDPSNEARRDRAAVLVQLGRWPEAVEVLRQAFDERTSSLRAEQVVQDRRFRALSGFDPFKHLVQSVREEQAGPFGRLLLKLEQLEASARAVEKAFDRVAAVGRSVSRLSSAVGVKTVTYILLSLLVAFGVSQLGVLGPPWTLVAGMGLTGLMWHVAAHVTTLGESDGLETIATGVGWVWGAWAVLFSTRWAWRRLRPTRAIDPFGKASLPKTRKKLETILALLSQVDAPGADQAMIQSRLRIESRELLELLDTKKAAEPSTAQAALRSSS